MKNNFSASVIGFLAAIVFCFFSCTPEPIEEPENLEGLDQVDQRLGNPNVQGIFTFEVTKVNGDPALLFTGNGFDQGCGTASIKYNVKYRLDSTVIASGTQFGAIEVNDSIQLQLDSATIINGIPLSNDSLIQLIPGDLYGGTLLTEDSTITFQVENSWGSMMIGAWGIVGDSLTIRPPSWTPPVGFQGTVYGLSVSQGGYNTTFNVTGKLRKAALVGGDLDEGINNLQLSRLLDLCSSQKWPMLHPVNGLEGDGEPLTYELMAKISLMADEGYVLGGDLPSQEIFQPVGSISNPPSGEHRYSQYVVIRFGEDWYCIGVSNPVPGPNWNRLRIWKLKRVEEDLTPVFFQDGFFATPWTMWGSDSSSNLTSSPTGEGTASAITVNGCPIQVTAATNNLSVDPFLGITW